jgi:hypothetical protein
MSAIAFATPMHFLPHLDETASLYLQGQAHRIVSFLGKRPRHACKESLLHDCERQHG